MLVLFEAAGGYAVFKLMDEKKLQKTDNLFKDFGNSHKVSKLITFKHFEKFQDTSDALLSASCLIEGKMSKKLKKMLKKVVLPEGENLAVSDVKLGNVIKDKLNISCISTSAIQELMYCIRSQIHNLIPEWNEDEESAMQLGLSRGIGRYKLKFSPDKVDTMIIQAVSLLDDLDKELNNYVMRAKEWYGWHFPELSKIVLDNNTYVKTILAMKMRENATETDFSEILAEDIEEKVKEMAEVSMGTEISTDDMLNIEYLCRNVLELQEYRLQLYEYLKNRMMAIAPNLTMLVGDLVGARLISHAGSLLSLAKHPASTVQILGAEKALFRALKTKHDTPKYGLIYHAQLIGQSNPKLKGKMSRMLAAKSALACRVDALGDGNGNELGVEHRAKLESRLKSLEDGNIRKLSGSAKGKQKFDKYEHKAKLHQYKPAADSTILASGKRKADEDDDNSNETPIFTKIKSESSNIDDAQDTPTATDKESRKKKKKKLKLEADESEDKQEETPKKKKVKSEKVEEMQSNSDDDEEETPKQKKASKKLSSKKLKKIKVEQDDAEEEQAPVEEAIEGSKKKKGKKSKLDESIKEDEPEKKKKKRLKSN